MFENISFGVGIINKYEDFNINREIPIEKQIDSLKEDLFQICYNNYYLIDVGWCPEFSIEGCFNITIVKNNDWENIIFSASCNDLNMPERYMLECIKIVQSSNY